jgi:hypothetical protein
VLAKVTLDYQGLMWSRSSPRARPTPRSKAGDAVEALVKANEMTIRTKRTRMNMD